MTTKNFDLAVHEYARDLTRYAGHPAEAKLESPLALLGG
jgi:hypothetical protein